MEFALIRDLQAEIVSISLFEVLQNTSLNGREHHLEHPPRVNEG